MLKYLRVKIDGNIIWKSHIDYLSAKLNRVTALLLKIRNVVNSSILIVPHLNYYSLVWSQNCNAIYRLVILQKKLLELLTSSHITHSSPLLKKNYSEILRKR